MEETDLLAPFDEKMPLSFDEFVMEIESTDNKEMTGESTCDKKGPSTSPVATSNVRHSTPIYQMLERIENKIKAEEHQKQFGFDDLIDNIQKTAFEQEKEDLWVDKYRPQKFTQLITMDSCNLEVLRWVKQWDFAKDLVLGKPKSEILQRVDEHRKSNNSKSRGSDNAKGHKGNGKPYGQHNGNSTHPARSNYEDQLERPERKILLIHGQPGLGKTTLAHVIAQTAGYSVLEINASDERMGNSVITKISSALEVKSSFTTDRKPSMVVIDEIDGAAAAGNENNLIKYLVKLATTVGFSGKNKKGSAKTVVKKDEDDSDTGDEDSTNSNDGVKSTKSKRSQSEQYGLLHPIICICNDLYVPALRPLRQVAHILQVKPIGPIQLSLRLKSICDMEGLKINARTLVDLAEVMDSDVRSTLNALQFLHKKTLTGSASNFNKELTFGAFKDTVKPPMKIYDAIFHNQSISNNSIAARNTSNARKNSELMGLIWGSGLGVDKLMTGCFEIYPHIKFFDNTTMDRVNAALDIFSSFDLMANSLNSSRLDNYLAYKLAGLKELFSTPVYSAIKYPKEDYENFQLISEKKAIFKDYLTGLPAKIRADFHSRGTLLLERIPVILNSSLSQFPQIKSSNPQLMRPEDKQKLMKSVEILSSEGLNLRQVKLPEGATYKFVIDSPIDRLITSECGDFSIYDNETQQDSHTYSLCRLVAAEMENLRIRKQKSKQAIDAKNPTVEEGVKPATPVKRMAPVDISQVKKRVARDFFGRPLAMPTEEEQELIDAKEVKMTIWYVQNDGVSNAVRRNIKISSFIN